MRYACVTEGHDPLVLHVASDIEAAATAYLDNLVAEGDAKFLRGLGVGGERCVTVFVLADRPDADVPEAVEVTFYYVLENSADATDAPMTDAVQAQLVAALGAARARREGTQ